MKEDARIERTRLRLAEAVLALAAERDITKTSVAELTRRARVNRSTFYAHAQSPVELLIRVLSTELDQVRQHLIQQLERDGLLLRDLSRATLREMIRHVVRHEAVYGSNHHPSSVYALRVVLAEHVQQSLSIVFGEGFVVPPVAASGSIGLYAAFIAHGVAGAVEAWLACPAPRHQQVLLAAIEAMYPCWYAPEAGLLCGRHAGEISISGEAS